MSYYVEFNIPTENTSGDRHTIYQWLDFQTSRNYERLRDYDNKAEWMTGALLPDWYVSDIMEPIREQVFLPTATTALIIPFALDEFTVLWVDDDGEEQSATLETLPREGYFTEEVYNDTLRGEVLELTEGVSDYTLTLEN